MLRDSREMEFANPELWAQRSGRWEELRKREADKSCVDFQLPLPRDVPGLRAVVVVPGGTSRTRRDKGQRQN